jgi:hypothetical protein
MQNATGLGTQLGMMTGEEKEIWLFGVLIHLCNENGARKAS